MIRMIDAIGRRLGFVALMLMLFAGNALAAETVTYFHTDGLGTPVMESDSAGQVIYAREHRPYGSQAIGTPKQGPGYTGHEGDVDTGLTYMQQRYYDPTIGRFLSVDPVTATSVGGNFNRYWYGNNNPYRFRDPDGRQPRRGEMDLCGTPGLCGTTDGAAIQSSMGRGDSGNVSDSTSNTSNGQANPSSTGDSNPRPATKNESDAASEEFPDIDTAQIRIAYGPIMGGFTPGNTIYFPNYLRGCKDFTTCDSGTHIAWFMHEVTHVWQHQNGTSPFLGHIFSVDVVSFGNYLDLGGYLRTFQPNPINVIPLNTEEQADWHMYNYLCRNNLIGGC
jgi:RHS repeat-associated protein